MNDTSTPQVHSPIENSNIVGHPRRFTKTLAYPDLDWKCAVTFDLDKTLTGLEGIETHATSESLHNYYTSLKERILWLVLHVPYRVQLPELDPATDTIQLGRVIEVYLVDYAKTPYHWLAVTDQCDLMQLIKHSKEDLQELAKEWYIYLERLQMLLNRAEQWLKVLALVA